MLYKAVLFGLVGLLAAGTTQVRADSDRARVIQGGGTSIVTGGGPGLAPVITKFGFHWRDGKESLSALPWSQARARERPEAGISIRMRCMSLERSLRLKFTVRAQY